jgi:hypothetical protein
LKSKFDYLILKHVDDPWHHWEEGVVLLVTVAAIWLLQMRKLNCIKNMSVCNAPNPVVLLFKVKVEWTISNPD